MVAGSLGSLPLFDEPPLAPAYTHERPGRPFADVVRDFTEFGRPSASIEDGGISYLINEFWTAGQRQAHSIHEVSYRACFKAQLPEFFISRLTEPTEAVYDPFMGRGTTPVQAGLMGRRPVGNDINPLSVLMTRPRLTPPAVPDIARRLGEIPWDSGNVDNADLLASISTVRELANAPAVKRTGE